MSTITAVQLVIGATRCKVLNLLCILTLCSLGFLLMLTNVNTKPKNNYLDYIKQDWSIVRDVKLQTTRVSFNSLDMPLIFDIADHIWWVSNRTTEEKIIESCRKKKYDVTELPSMSVILTFHETEKIEHLLRTIHALVKHSAKELLKEILLISDNSKTEAHQQVLHNYVTALFPALVKIHRSNVSLGLIKARHLGVQLATADVVCCLDSHMEVRPKWMEPILQEIKNNKNTMVTPMLDWMKPEKDGNWTYQHGSSRYKTIWSWSNSMWFTLQEVPDGSSPDQTAAIVSPCSVGIFAIERNYFHEIGGMDPEMEFWGAENIDLALRAFLFGGRHVNMPCSHVAHMEEPGQKDYRAKTKHDVSINYLRMVETWFTDQYKETVYLYNPTWKGKSPGDISERLELKKKAKFDFDYYMKHYYSELRAPNVDTFAWGFLKNVGMMNVSPSKAKVCVGGNLAIFEAIMSDCSALNPETSNIFWTTDGELRLANHIIQHPLQPEVSVPKLESYVPIFGTSRISRFIHYKGGLIREYKDGQMGDYCLSVIKPTEEQPQITSKICNKTDSFQQWKFTEYTKHYTDFMEGTNIRPVKGFQKYYTVLNKFLKDLN